MHAPGGLWEFAPGADAPRHPLDVGPEAAPGRRHHDTGGAAHLDRHLPGGLARRATSGAAGARERGVLGGHPVGGAAVSASPGNPAPRIGAPRARHFGTWRRERRRRARPPGSGRRLGPRRDRPARRAWGRAADRPRELRATREGARAPSRRRLSTFAATTSLGPSGLIHRRAEARGLPPRPGRRARPSPRARPTNWPMTRPSSGPRPPRHPGAAQSEGRRARLRAPRPRGTAGGVDATAPRRAIIGASRARGPSEERGSIMGGHRAPAGSGG